MKTKQNRAILKKRARRTDGRTAAPQASPIPLDVFRSRYSPRVPIGFLPEQLSTASSMHRVRARDEHESIVSSLFGTLFFSWFLSLFTTPIFYLLPYTQSPHICRFGMSKFIY
jgi:hypothetical protein